MNVSGASKTIISRSLKSCQVEAVTVKLSDLFLLSAAFFLISQPALELASKNNENAARTGSDSANGDNESTPSQVSGGEKYNQLHFFGDSPKIIQWRRRGWRR